MNIDIDIRISEEGKEDGKHFIKHFSGKLDSYLGIPLVNSGDNRKFEEFLSEVLTGNGQKVRRSLLGCNKQRDTEKQSERLPYGAEELQYTLRLGTGQSLTGRIPLGDLNLFSAPEVISGITSEKKIGKSKEHESFLLNKYYSCINKRKNSIHFHEAEKVIHTIMRKVINKYENNIFYGTDL